MFETARTKKIAVINSILQYLTKKNEYDQQSSRALLNEKERKETLYFSNFLQPSVKSKESKENHTRDLTFILTALMLIFGYGCQTVVRDPNVRLASSNFD